MPSSHGGGFSGGGGHGGFHSSGGSHGSSGYTPRYSRTRPIPGATRYSYMNRHGHLCYFYYVGVPHRSSYTKSIFPLVLGLIFAVAIFAFMISATIPHKLSSSLCKEVDTVVLDNAGLFNNEESAALTKSLDKYYEKTGIQAVLYTLNDTEFPSGVYGNLSKYSLEDYAYDLYLDLFNDEGHLLIVYVNYTRYSTRGYMWLDMAGDNTSSAFTDDDFELLQTNMNNNLNNSKLSISEAIVKSFDKLTEKSLVIQTETKKEIIGLSVVGIALVGLLIFAIVRKIIEQKEINGYVDYAKSRPDVSYNDMPKDDPYRDIMTNRRPDEDPFKE